MKRAYIELSCDNCGNGDYYAPATWRAAARRNGWIITQDSKHFCCKKCRAEYRIAHAKP